MGRGTATVGLDEIVGGRAKSGVVRTLAQQHAARVSELVAAVGMSKNAVLNAVRALEVSGAVTTRRAGRDILVEALPLAEEMFLAMARFDAAVHAPPAILPSPGEPLSANDRLAFAEYLAASGAAPVPTHDWQADELSSGIAPAWAGRAPVA